MTDWSTKPHPKDGSLFYVRSWNVVKWTPYHPTSPQRKKGLYGRWQYAGEHSGWENGEEPKLPWKPVLGNSSGPFEEHNANDMVMVSRYALDELYRAFLSGQAVSEESMARCHHAITGKDDYGHDK